MNFVQGINDLFSNLEKYIKMLTDYLSGDDLRNLLMYLYNCIPEPIRGVFILVILLFALIGFIKAIRD